MMLIAPALQCITDPDAWQGCSVLQQSIRGIGLGGNSMQMCLLNPARGKVQLLVMLHDADCTRHSMHHRP